MPGYNAVYKELTHMSATSKIVKDMHVHKPVTQMVMAYTDESGKRCTHLIRMGQPSGEQLILKTLRWASHRGIEVTFRPA